MKDIDYDIGESIKEDDDGEVIDERYASLFSYKSLSQSYQSAYELPWFIRWIWNGLKFKFCV